MCCVLIVAGKTGVGKSTITDYINQNYGLYALSFADMGKSFATRHNQKRLRDCYCKMNRDDFVTCLVNDMKETILKTIHEHSIIIIDGLYSYYIIQELKKHNKVIVMYIDADDEVRLSRISRRLQTDNSNAKIENDIKEEIKSVLGNDKIMEMADYFINGNKTLVEVLSDVRNIINSVI